MSDSICQASGVRFTVTAAEREMLLRVGELNPLAGGPLPPPCCSPCESLRRASVFGNILNIHRSRSALSGKPQLSRYDPALGYRICTDIEFWSDEIDNMAFGAPYDFSRSFFEQWDELLHRVYLLALRNSQSENCSYCNGCDRSRDCYLCFDTTDSEGCLYCSGNAHGTGNIDCIAVNACSYCYSCTDCENCYECQECADCENCTACADCRGSQDCIGCWGLNHSRFCVFNEQMTQAQYREFIGNSGLHLRKPRQEMLARFRKAFKESGHIINRIIASEDCSGCFIRNSRRAQQCFLVNSVEDCGYVLWGLDAKNCWKGTFFGGEFNYYGVGTKSSNCHFCYGVNCSDSCWYSFYLFQGCAQCFGCAGLKRKSYCILNKQYTKQEYYDLTARIVKQMKERGEWGEWFPLHLSPHYYEEGWADDFLDEIPIDEVRRRGFKVRLNNAARDAALPPLFSPVPEDAAAASPEQVLGRTFRCSETGQAFNIQAAELQFHKKYGIALPTVHWRERIRRGHRVRPRMPVDAS